MHLATRATSLLLLLVPAAAVVGQAVTPQSSRGDPAALVARIDSIAMDHVNNGPAASITVAVVRGRDTLVMRGYGLADRDTKRAAGPTTVYEIGSITKQFTSSAIMRLVEQGKINLDDDLSKYLRFPLQGHHVTIRQLLNHTSGIHSYTSKREWASTWAQDFTPDSIVGFVARDTFDFAPGAAWRYNNTGYVLLGMVIEKVSGKPYATYLGEQFFKPLGLKQLSYCPSHTSDTSFAKGYSSRAGTLSPSAYLSMTHPFAAGALCASVRDYLVWQRALHGGRVVSARSYQLMTTPDTLNDGKKLDYGFGLSVGQLGTHRMIAHGGGINGFTTAQMYFPDDTLSVIAFTNTDGVGPDVAARNIAAVVFGLPLVSRPAAPTTVALDASERDKLSGTYDLKRPDGTTMGLRIFVEANTLMAEPEGPGQRPAALSHLGNNIFAVQADPTIRVQFVIENGKVTGLRLIRPSLTMEGSRRP